MEEFFCGVTINRFGVDESFMKLFRMDLDGLVDDVDDLIRELNDSEAVTTEELLWNYLPLDRLSLLACHRQGMQVHELLFQDITTSANSGASNPASGSLNGQRVRLTAADRQKLMEAKQAAETLRRQGKLDIIERERQRIVAVLRTVDVTQMHHHRKLTTEQNELLVQMKAQQAFHTAKHKNEKERAALSPSRTAEHESAEHHREPLPLACNDPAEADLCEALLRHRTGLDSHERLMKKHLHRVEQKSHDALERQKSIQRKGMVCEVTEALERHCMLLEAAAKEKVFERKQQERRQQAVEQAALRDEQRREKRLRCVERFRQSILTRRAQIELRSLYREERSELSQQERETSRVQRRLQHEAEALASQQRIENVSRQREEYLELQREELKAKMLLHASQKEALRLRREAGRLLRNNHSESRGASVSSRSATATPADATTASDAGLTQAEWERRSEAVYCAHRERAQLIRESIEKRQTAAAVQRASLTKAAREHQMLLQRECEEKDKRAERVGRQKLLDRTIRGELSAIKMDHHQENQRRVLQAQAFRNEVRKHLADEVDLQAKKASAFEQQCKKDVERVLVEVARERDQMKTTIQRLQHDPSVLRRAIEVAEIGGDGGQHGPADPSTVAASSALLKQQAERIITTELSKVSLRPSSAMHRTTTDESPVVGPAAAVPKRPQSANPASLRTPSRPTLTDIATPVTMFSSTQKPVTVSPVVARRLAEIDELGDFALRAADEALKERRAAPDCNPVTELVRRMDVLYHHATSHKQERSNQ